MLPTATAAAEVETATTPAPPPAVTTAERAAVATRPRANPRRHVATAPTAPGSVLLRIVPTESSYICVADGSTGEKLWEGMRTGPYTVRRASLFLRIGVGTARITVNGRPLTVDVAPSTYALTPAGVRPAAGRSACAG